MAIVESKTPNRGPWLLLLGAGALAYIFAPLAPPPDFSRQFGVLRKHKDQSESSARFLSSDLQARRVVEEVWKEGRDRYTTAAAKFNGCIESLDFALKGGVLDADFPARFDDAVRQSNSFNAWYGRSGHRSDDKMDAPVGGGVASSPPSIDLVKPFQEVVEWAQKMRQKRQDAAVNPIRDELQKLLWRPFDKLQE